MQALTPPLFCEKGEDISHLDKQETVASLGVKTYFIFCIYLYLFKKNLAQLVI